MKVSLIIPCYNEEGNVFPLYEAVRAAFDGVVPSYELVYVDDGSYDGTGEKLRELTDTADVPVKAVRFSRNFGKEAAILAGLNEAAGDSFTIMDGDLQQSPSVVVEMVRYLEDHPDCDCVTAFQENRHESPVMVFFKNGFYNIINRVADTEFVNGASDFRTFRNNVREAVLSLPEGARFSKGIFSWVGFKTHWLEYVNRERAAGETKWSFRKLFLYSIDGITAFSTAPLAVASYSGMAICAVSFIALLVVFIRALLYGDPVAGWPSMVCIILFLGGIQLLCIGVLGQYLAKTYLEVKNRPQYVLQEENVDE